MTLEKLFASPGQGEIFLWMAGIGALAAVIGDVLHLIGGSRVLTLLGDILPALILSAGLVGTGLRFGEGLRAYALLGAMLGAVLWYAGGGVVMKKMKKICHSRQERRHHMLNQ